MKENIMDRFTMFMRCEKGFSERTIETYLKGLKALYVEYGGEILEIQEYKDFSELLCRIRDKRRWSDRTTYKTVCEAAVFYGWALRMGITKDSPLKFGHHFKRSEKKEIDFFDWSSPAFRRLIYNPMNSVRDNAIFHTLRSSGIRASELCNLKIQDADLKERWFKIRQGKGGKDRYSPFDDETKTWLELYIPQLRLQSRLEWLFQAEDFDRPLNSAALYKLISRKGAKLGIHAYPHKFRSSLGGEMIQRGADLSVVQQVLGHKNCSTTANYYVNFKKEKLRDLYDKVVHP